MVNSLPIYLGLAIIGGISFVIDVFGHKGQPTTRSSVLWTLFWIAVGLGFGGYVYLVGGETAASEYYSGYLMEKALSFDNLMVFLAIFTFFNIKDQHTVHKILTYGIVGAIVFRAIFVGAGSWIFNLGPVFEAIFGAIVLYSAWKLMHGSDSEVDYDKAWYVKLIRKVCPVDTRDGATTFTSVVNGVRHVTPLLLCVFAIELTDVIFSFDSVPAVIAVSKETAIIYSAMIMAVLGLRALYFVIQILVEKLHMLDKFVAAILVFIGIKLLIGAAGFELDSTVSLSIVAGLLVAGTITSLVIPPKGEVE